MIRAVLFDFDGTLTRPEAIDFGVLRQRLGCPPQLYILEFIQTLPTEDERREALVEVVDLVVGRVEAEPAVADHLGGHALQHLRLRLAVEREREVAVRVDVDEAGREHQAARVDRLVGGERRAADLGDDAVLEDKVAVARRGAAAVDDPSAGEEHAHGQRR